MVSSLDIDRQELLNSSSFTDKVRAQFPYLKTYPNLCYFDSASTTQKPQCVIDALSHYYTKSNANAHRGVYKLSELSSNLLEQARENIAQHIGASPEEIIFTRGTTESLNIVAHSFLKNRLTSSGTILLTEVEHHANIVPWQIIAQEKNSTVSYIPVDKEGNLDLVSAKNLISKKPNLVSLTHISNVIGSTNPIEEIVTLAKAQNIPVCIDGAQAIGHQNVNVHEIGCDFYAFSGHKAYGPMGIGVLYVNKKWHDHIYPFLTGGGMIEDVDLQSSSYREMPYLLEAGTQSIADIHGLCVAIDYLNSLQLKKIQDHESALTTYALDKILEIEGIKILGPLKNRTAPIISFTIAELHPHDLATILDSKDIAVRAGHHCSQHAMKRFSVSATLRASFAAYNNFAEIDHLVDSIYYAKKIFHKRQ